MSSIIKNATEKRKMKPRNLRRVKANKLELQQQQERSDDTPEPSWVKLACYSKRGGFVYFHRGTMVTTDVCPAEPWKPATIIERNQYWLREKQDRVFHCHNI